MLSFQKIILDTSTPDRDAILVYRYGRLFAVLSCLSEIHGDLCGKWFVEATFSNVPDDPPQTFESLDHFTQWLSLSE